MGSIPPIECPLVSTFGGGGRSIARGTDGAKDICGIGLPTVDPSWRGIAPEDVDVGGPIEIELRAGSMEEEEWWGGGTWGRI